MPDSMNKAEWLRREQRAKEQRAKRDILNGGPLELVPPVEEEKSCLCLENGKCSVDHGANKTAEIIAAVVKHSMVEPLHGIGCACLDVQIRALREIVKNAIGPETVHVSKFSERWVSRVPNGNFVCEACPDGYLIRVTDDETPVIYEHIMAKHSQEVWTSADDWEKTWKSRGNVRHVLTALMRTL